MGKHPTHPHNYFPINNYIQCQCLVRNLPSQPCVCALLCGKVVVDQNRSQSPVLAPSLAGLGGLKDASGWLVVTGNGTCVECERGPGACQSQLRP